MDIYEMSLMDTETIPKIHCDVIGIEQLCRISSPSFDSSLIHSRIFLRVWLRNIE